MNLPDNWNQDAYNAAWGNDDESSQDDRMKWRTQEADEYRLTEQD